MSNWLPMLILVVLAGLLPASGNAQERMYLGLHAGANAHLSSFAFGATNIEQAAASTPVVHFSADLRLDRAATYLHVGVGSFIHRVGYNLTELEYGRGFLELSGGFNIQLALKRRFQVWRNRLFVVPMLGVQVGNYRGYPEGLVAGSVLFDGDEPIIENVWVKPFNRQFFPYVIGGLGLEYAFDFGLVVSARAFYAHGLRKVVEGTVSYQRLGGTSQRTRFFSRFSHVPIELGVSYPVSRIWEGKP